MTRLKFALLCSFAHLAVLSGPVSAKLVAPQVMAQTITGPGVTSVNGQTGSVSLTIPVPATTAQLMPTLNGTVGTSNQYQPIDAAPISQVQTANTTLGTDCTWSVTFQRAFLTSTPIVHANVQLSAGATQPVPCAVISRSTTTQSGKCFPGQTATLNLSIVTAGLTLSPFASTCTTMPVMVVAREPTQ